MAQAPACMPASREPPRSHQICCEEVVAKVPKLPLDAGSGFDWLPCNRFELHLYNIRHLQHHTGQLIERLRTVSDVGASWIRMGS